MKRNRPVPHEYSASDDAVDAFVPALKTALRDLVGRGALNLPSETMHLDLRLLLERYALRGDYMRAAAVAVQLHASSDTP